MKPKEGVKRIIPCLDMNGGRVVKGVQFENLVDAGDPLKTACFYDQEGADELVFLDITATTQNRESILLDVVQKVAQKIKIPFTVGGGIHSLKEIEALINAGASKVSLNTAVVKNPTILEEGAKKIWESIFCCGCGC